jgi:hypothetical protein
LEGKAYGTVIWRLAGMDSVLVLKGKNQKIAAFGSSYWDRVSLQELPKAAIF